MGFNFPQASRTFSIQNENGKVCNSFDDRKNQFHLISRYSSSFMPGLDQYGSSIILLRYLYMNQQQCNEMSDRKLYMIEVCIIYRV